MQEGDWSLVRLRLRLHEIPPHTVVAPQALEALRGQQFGFGAAGREWTAVIERAWVEEGWIVADAVTPEHTDPALCCVRDVSVSPWLEDLLLGGLGLDHDWDHDLFDPRGYKAKPPDWSQFATVVTPARLQQRLRLGRDETRQ